MSNGPLGLQDEDFWGDYRKTERQVMTRIEREEIRGLLIDAPSYVPLATRQTVPVVGWHVRTLREDRTLKPMSQTFVTAVDLEINQLRIGLAFDTGKIPGPSGPTAEADPGEGSTLNMFDFDLRRALAIPWRPGRYRIAMILRERLSNLVTLELGPSQSTYQDLEVLKFLEEERRKIPPAPAAVWPLPLQEARFPNYGHDMESPPIPDEPGIALTADRVTLAEPGAACKMRGSFRLPVLRQERVAPDPKTGILPEVGDPRATAVLPITLIATGSETPGPFVLNLKVPSHDHFRPEEDSPVVTGHFNLDLFRLQGTPRRAMTYHFYAFCGEHAAGPATVGLVTRDMLPYKRK